MSEIEFLDPEAPEPDASEAAPPAGEPRRRTLATRLAAILFAAAAALAVVAPFQKLFQFSETGPFPIRYSIDGWGRLAGLDEQTSSHSIRFGVATVAAAAVLLMSAVLALAGRRRAVLPTALGATAFLAGVGAVAALNVQAYSDTLEDSRSIGDGGPGVARVALDVGPFLWLAAAGVLAGALGCALWALTGRRSRLLTAPSAPVPAPDAPQ